MSGEFSLRHLYLASIVTNICEVVTHRFTLLMTRKVREILDGNTRGFSKTKRTIKCKKFPLRFYGTTIIIYTFPNSLNSPNPNPLYYE